MQKCDTELQSAAVQRDSTPPAIDPDVPIPAELDDLYPRRKRISDTGVWPVFVMGHNLQLSVLDIKLKDGERVRLIFPTMEVIGRGQKKQLLIWPHGAAAYLHQQAELIDTQMENIYAARSTDTRADVEPDDDPGAVGGSGIILPRGYRRT